MHRFKASQHSLKQFQIGGVKESLSMHFQDSNRHRYSFRQETCQTSSIHNPFTIRPGMRMTEKTWADKQTYISSTAISSKATDVSATIPAAGTSTTEACGWLGTPLQPIWHILTSLQCSHMHGWKELEHLTGEGGESNQKLACFKLSIKGRARGISQSMSKKLVARPRFSTRPVRPMRWTYSSMPSGKS